MNVAEVHYLFNTQAITMDFILNDTDIKVQQYLNTLSVKYDAHYVGAVGGKWPHDKFNVILTAKEKSPSLFEFSTGLGHRVKLKNYKIPSITSFNGNKHKELTGWTKAFISNDSFRPEHVVVKPTAANVLFCILCDGTAVDVSFHDWASDYGYDTDSISARNTYDACCAIGIKLRTLFTSEERTALTALLQDY
jgi:hypothetical protein